MFTINNLHIYDFDETLFKNDTQEWNENIVDLAKNSKARVNTLSVLCTARSNNHNVVRQTKDLLMTKNLYFDKYIFKPESANLHNAIYKEIYIARILDLNKSIKSVFFWDDCEINLDFVGMMVEKRGIIFHPVKM